MPYQNKQTTINHLITEHLMPGMVTLLALFSLSLPVSVSLVTLRVVLIVIAALIISLIIR